MTKCSWHPHLPDSYDSKNNQPHYITPNLERILLISHDTICASVNHVKAYLIAMVLLLEGSSLNNPTNSYSIGSSESLTVVSNESQWSTPPRFFYVVVKYCKKDPILQPAAFCENLVNTAVSSLTNTVTSVSMFSLNNTWRRCPLLPR